MAGGPQIRIDKWLWQARFVKTRTLAVSLVSGGKLRINGQKITKPGRSIGPGDILTLSMQGGVKVLEVLACGERRGPAPEARLLYRDLDETGVSPDPDDVEQPV
ncbi:RNA-binding S4 domain-containing protein [Thioclava sp. GXIMD4216]|uniref:RNA-binding S4 domain-containing protein n=1 Tax=Thioclava litoralis TaxID=3076557 RepID=A0ABZ1E022_9RHOB|nr:RNA-binding S4 domain-containing protein [Thioclava sp. FTW29]